MAPDDTDDPLDELRERLRATQAAAERLAGEAAGARAAWEAGEDPGARWATTGEHGARNDEVQALAALLGTLRELVPADLEAQVREVLRQVLLLLRAIVDWWVERLEGPPAAAHAAAPGGAASLEDIPVD